MLKVCWPAVAGLFYPDNPKKLRGMLEEYLRAVRVAGATPKAIIAPHAGYIFSGPVAASAYALFLPLRGLVERVVVLGPSHRVPLRGLAMSSADTFATPLGQIPVDHEAWSLIEDLPQVSLLDRPHTQEHSLEVQLPFLQEVLGDFRLVPLVVGDAGPAEVAEVMERLWGGPETRFVISSDLSHYHDYLTAKRLDRSTSQAIAELRPQDIHFEDACGRIPVQGLLEAARRHALVPRILDLRNSGDTAGPRDQVVGYGAYAFEEAA